ncbi:MAG TPA: M20/M25/M40 family metallo-hydrolase [Steroidobacter sp.]
MSMASRAALSIFLACGALAMAPAVHAQWSEQQLATAAALRDHATSGTQAYEHLTSLVTEVGPRLAGSSGDTAAVRWAMNKLASLGFSNVRSQDVLVPRWVRGEAQVTLLTPHPQPLVALALGGSVGTPEEGIEAQVVEVASLEALKALKPEAVRGKIVFINQRMERARDGRGYGATVRNRTQGASAAADLGAVAIVIRSVGTSDNRIAHTGTVSYRVDAPRIPAFAISNPDADQLARHLKAGKPVRLHVKSTARELSPAWSANVIGEIPGQGERANEIVLLGAHLDSWDPGQGALDDGAGVAIVMEAARLIAGLKERPARTIRVVLFANEEFGLSGAREYARLAGEGNEVARHVIGMEADLGAGPVWRVQSQVAAEALPAIDKLREVLAPLGIESGNNQAHAGADLSPMRELGMPVLDLSLDATQYFDVHHTINDTLDKVDRKALDQSVAAFAVAAYLSATKEGDFGRIGTREQPTADRVSKGH